MNFEDLKSLVENRAYYTLESLMNEDAVLQLRQPISKKIDRDLDAHYLRHVGLLGSNHNQREENDKEQSFQIEKLLQVSDVIETLLADSDKDLSLHNAQTLFECFHYLKEVVNYERSIEVLIKSKRHHFAIACIDGRFMNLLLPKKLIGKLTATMPKLTIKDKASIMTSLTMESMRTKSYSVVLEISLLLMQHYVKNRALRENTRGRPLEILLQHLRKDSMSMYAKLHTFKTLI